MTFSSSNLLNWVCQKCLLRTILYIIWFGTELWMTFHGNWNIPPCYQATGFCKMLVFGGCSNFKSLRLSERGFGSLSVQHNLPQSKTSAEAACSLRKRMHFTCSEPAGGSPKPWSAVTRVLACTVCPALPPGHRGLRRGKTSALAWPKHASLSCSCSLLPRWTAAAGPITGFHAEFSLPPHEHFHPLTFTPQNLFIWQNPLTCLQHEREQLLKCQSQ